ncbi:hypothetical protein [Streptomyces sp. VRA16 Mangrove soil]|uniref:hypothetical protein n=1 Tax=Streptomyces sp. VRA16 Mangrove soil TaxID=2817434 RepID=UPI001A9E627C|nr:hypothetical protein [Streptomyces sp. VRA16 Mangrove soil]MBO1330018.1 hypothetical protein [Streptomyces sp. VRA16 Mangrove soil]
MTGPTGGNPYGVRVPDNKPRLPGLPPPPVDDHPLVPWEDGSHIGQWADVDHARTQLDHFRRSLVRLEDVLNPRVGRGRLVIVSGPVGMGKTTLIHRCIHETIEHLKALSRYPHPETDGAPRPTVPRHFVAIPKGYDNDGGQMHTNDNGERAGLEAINAQISAGIVGELAKHFPDWQNQPADNEPIRTTSEKISQLLAMQNSLLFAVIPHIEWYGAGLRTNFLRTCLNRAVTRVVLFAEVSHGDGEDAARVVEEIGASQAITHLALGPLEEEDTMKFSQSRPSDHPAHAVLPDLAREGLLRAHREWRPRDVREMRKVFYATAECRRHDRADAFVTYEDLRPHLPGRPNLDDLRWDPPPPPDPQPGE